MGKAASIVRVWLLGQQRSHPPNALLQQPGHQYIVIGLECLYYLKGL